MDTTACYSDTIYRLGFQNSGEVTSTSWVTAAELYQWADELARKLSLETGMFVNLDIVNVFTGTAAYSTPNDLFVVSAALMYADLSIHPIRITPQAVLWALDSNWQATSGPPTRCSFDAGAVGTTTLYPKPDAGANASFLFMVAQQAPATINAGAPIISLPTVLQDMFTYAMLAGARRKESDNAMPEMAAHFQERVNLYEAVCRHLWGPGVAG